MENQVTKRKILIVEDEEIIRDILTEMLSDEYDINAVNNGEEALNELKANPNIYSLILLDMVMPVMDGKTFLAKKHEEKSFKNVPVIVLTSDENVEEEVLRSGALDYIKKPFDKPNVIKARIFRIIDLYEKHNISLSEEEVVPALKIVDL